MAKITYYGKLAERIGREIEVELPAGGCTIAVLRARFDGLGQEPVQACVNDVTVSDDCVVMPGDRVDFLPPLSGG